MSTLLEPATLPHNIWAAIRRGIRLKCPRCGQEKLFRSYLKPVSTCPNCQKDWENVRADLAPAWAAMTFSAHFIIPLYHFFIFDGPLPNWAATLLMIIIATSICLVTLPSFKGLFMTIVWWHKMEKEQQS
ncbi:uncharacterized protein (DUF983 family) [Litorimonas taeanensis]|uniref:Uncharacterized protein (DUF983 family) n=1 Tax=Litorimonas taeanensis TaxID=568099 RepID=A0A420WEI8_9PROT|nr:DUF983 domain-containing protein [Litorimonas taeanensis]RKQ69312.1 uncharacterized protein (DUF983 family) [Litorimonas taeanensis]